MLATRPKLSDSLPRKVITPITGALSLVIGISGVMLFFHLEEGLVKGVHEWLGMAFILVMLAHLALNWRTFKQHFTKPAAWLGAAAVSAITVMFLIASLSMPHENPMRSVIHSIETVAVSDLAPVFKLTPSQMATRLNQAGAKIETGRETLQELAGKSGVEPRSLIAALTSSTGPDINKENNL
jgi:protein-S-isoprenylcysteine O-methyltransferase Ste14